MLGPLLVYNPQRGAEVCAKVEELNAVMYERFGNDPLVARSLPIRVSLSFHRTDYQVGKPAKHAAAASQHGVSEGTHVDDAPDICDMFAVRWRDESHVFRVQYSRPRENDEHTHRNPRICFRNGEDAMKCILSYHNIAALCGRQ